MGKRNQPHHPLYPNIDFYFRPDDKMPVSPSLLETIIFSWPTVGLAIAQAKEWGWRMNIIDDRVAFVEIESKTTRHVVSGAQLLGHKHTNWFSIIDLGDITAILSAFADIPKPVGKEGWWGRQ